MSERVSILFRNQDTIALQTEKGAETLRRTCIASTIIGTYANIIFGDCLFGPLAKQVGFEAKGQEEQLRQFLYKNFYSLKNAYDDKVTIIRRMSAESYDRSDGKEVLIRIDDSVSAIATALKFYCPPGKSKKKDTLFRMCQSSIKQYVKGSSAGDAYRSMNASILLANQHSWKYLERYIGSGASAYLSVHMDASRKYSELFPKDFQKNHKFAVSYASPLFIQQKMLEGECIVYVETQYGRMNIIDAVDRYWRLFSSIKETNNDKTITGMLEEVRARINCMGAILAFLVFDIDDPNIFTIRIPDDFNDSKAADASRSVSVDNLRQVSAEQAAMVARSPRMCLAHASDLIHRYCEVKRGIVTSILSSVGEERDVLIGGEAGWGKSSTLILAYLRMASMSSGPVPLLLNTSALRGFTGGPNSSVPIAFGGFVDIREGDDVVLFIDSIDEYFALDSRDLARTLVSLHPHRLVVAGRTNICLHLKEWIDIDMIEIVPDTDSYVSDILDMYSHGNGLKLRRFLDESGIRIPMLIAMSARYVDSAGDADVWRIFSQALDRMVLERLDGIRQDCKEIDANSVFMILEEYAWMDYRDDAASVDRICRVSSVLGMDSVIVSRAVQSFTDSEGRFLHSMIRDYLVSEWVFRQASRRCIRDDLYDKLLGSDVQRMIGHRLSADRRGSMCLIDWYEAEVSRSHCNDKEDLCKAVAMCYLARVVISSDSESNAVRKVYAFFDESYKTLLSNPECPQMMVVCDTLAQKGRMDVEETYVSLLERSQKFASICRNTYMAYAGDIDLQDINGDYDDAPWMSIHNTASMLLRTLSSSEARHMFLIRADVTLMMQLLKSGYCLDHDVLDRIRDLNLESIVNRIKFNNDFTMALKRYGMDVEEYCNILSNRLNEFAIIANSRLATGINMAEWEK